MFLLALFFIGSAYPAVEPPAAVCGQSRVLEAVQQRLSRAGQPVLVEHGSAGQVPGERVDIVYCAVRVHTIRYDTPRFGPTPVDDVRVYNYTLELRRNGIFLLP